MKINIIMPKMGESLNEGTIIKWYKNIGDFVKKDEIIFEITTDKVDTEIPSPAEGILSEIFVKEQETVEVNTVVAIIDTDISINSKKQDFADEETVKNESKTNSSDIILNEDTQDTNKLKQHYSIAEKSVKSFNTFYSPAVLNIIQKENLSIEELKKVIGTGANGRVTKKDILNYVLIRHNNGNEEIIAEKKGKNNISNVEETEIKWKEGENSIKIPMNNIRQQIMKHMVNSRDTSVHVAEVMEVDITRIYNFIKVNKESFYRKENIKLTYMPFIAIACINALKELPYLNSSIVDNNIVLRKNINLGIAIALIPDGLIVPNIKNADEKSFRKIAMEIDELSEKTKKKQLTFNDVSGGTFTISNYGVFGTLFGTPIINQPEVAILGVGTVTKKPVVVEVDGMDTISIRSMMYLTLSHDHRLIDGMLGGKFLKSIKNFLENFKPI
jgi:2-oxoglutarate dehydrogenase complex dihydrolipoamide succinyltransferase (E2) component